MNNKTLRRLYLTITVSLNIFIVLLLLRLSPHTANFFTLYISQYIVSIAGFVNSLLPFAIFEWFVIIAIGFFIFFIVRLVVNIKTKKSYNIKRLLSILTICIFTFINTYLLSASFAYYRSPLELPKYQQTLTAQQAKTVCDFYIADYQQLVKKATFDEDGNFVSPYSFDEVVEKIRAEYAKLDSHYFYFYTPKAKPVLLSKVMSYEHILGMFFSPFGEANINADVPQYMLPSTIAHELAHSKGVMREYEANMLATYITLNSDDDYIRMCGYYEYFFHIAELAQYGTDKEYSKNFTAIVDPNVTKMNIEYINYWSNFNSIFSNISRFFNDLYLKLSGMDNGTGDYTDSSGGIINDGTDEDGDPIYKLEYSDTLRIILNIYFTKSNA